MLVTLVEPFFALAIPLFFKGDKYIPKYILCDDYC